MLNIGIVGSREFSRLSLVRDLVLLLPAGTLVVSGGAIGVDRTAERAAYRRSDLPEPRVHKPQWYKYDKRAGFIRNQLIVDNSDIVIAFWNRRSRGTEDTLKKARFSGKPAYVIDESFSEDLSTWLASVLNECATRAAT